MSVDDATEGFEVVDEFVMFFEDVVFKQSNGVCNSKSHVAILLFKKLVFLLPSQAFEVFIDLFVLLVVVVVVTTIHEDIFRLAMHREQKFIAVRKVGRVLLPREKL